MKLLTWDGRPAVTADEDGKWGSNPGRWAVSKDPQPHQPQPNLKPQPAKAPTQPPSKYQSKYQLTTDDIFLLICLFLSTVDFIAPIPFTLLVEWLRAAKANPTQTQAQGKTKRSVIVNTNGENGYWIRCVFQLPSVLCTGSSALFDA